MSDADDQARARAELARRAVEGAARGEGAAQRKRAAAAAEERRSEARARAALREAVLGGSRAFIAVIALSTLVGVGGGAVLIACAGERAWLVGLGIAAMVVGAAVAWCSRYVIGARAITAEARWLAGLGFAVEGYLEVLSVEPHDCRLAVTIEFATEVAPNDTVRGLVGLVDGQVEAQAGRRIVVRSGELSTDGGDGPSHNRAIYGWLRRAFVQVVVPLHRGYPLARVRVSR